MTPENVTHLNGCLVKSGGRVTDWSANENNMGLQAKWNRMAANVGNWEITLHVVPGMKE